MEVGEAGNKEGGGAMVDDRKKESEAKGGALGLGEGGGCLMIDGKKASGGKGVTSEGGGDGVPAEQISVFSEPATPQPST